MYVYCVYLLCIYNKHTCMYIFQKNVVYILNIFTYKLYDYKYRCKYFQNIQYVCVFTFTFSHLADTFIQTVEALIYLYLHYITNLYIHKKYTQNTHTLCKQNFYFGCELFDSTSIYVYACVYMYF